MGLFSARGDVGQAKEREVRLMVWEGRLGFAIAIATLPFAGWLIGEIFGSPFPGAWIGGSIALISLALSFGGQDDQLEALGLRQPTARESRLLQPMLEDLARAAAVPAPELRILQSPAGNAFAVQRVDGAIVGITSGALSELEPREIRAVLAHEVAHLQHRDTFLLGWHATAITALTVLVTAEALLGLGVLGAAGRGRRGKGAEGAVALLLLLLLIGGVSYLVGVLLSKVFGTASNRQLELAADARGAILCADGFALASALAKMSGPQSVLARNTPLTSFFIVDLATRSSAADDLFATHPDVGLRIDRLQSLAGALGHPAFIPSAVQAPLCQREPPSRARPAPDPGARPRRRIEADRAESPAHPPREPALYTVYVALCEAQGCVLAEELFRRVRAVRPLGRTPEEAHWRFQRILRDLQTAGVVRIKGPRVCCLLDTPCEPECILGNDIRADRTSRSAGGAAGGAGQRARRKRTVQAPPGPSSGVAQPQDACAPAGAPTAAEEGPMPEVVAGIGFESAARSAQTFLCRHGHAFGSRAEEISLVDSAPTPDGGYRLVYAYWGGSERPFAVDVSASGQIRGITALAHVRDDED